MLLSPMRRYAVCGLTMLKTTGVPDGARLCAPMIVPYAVKPSADSPSKSIVVVSHVSGLPSCECTATP